MIKVAVLDDYQNVFQQIVDVKNYKNKFDFKVFNQSFTNEKEAIIALEDFEALFIMRERTPITKTLIENLPKLKYIITSGMRNNAIDLETAKSRNIIVCGTEINSNPAAEVTWALILGLYRNMKQEIDNMFQGYWQTTIGFELKDKMLNLQFEGEIQNFGNNTIKDEALSALSSLGISKNIVEKHINDILDRNNDISLEDLIKEVLKRS